MGDIAWDLVWSNWKVLVILYGIFISHGISWGMMDVSDYWRLLEIIGYTPLRVPIFMICRILGLSGRVSGHLQEIIVLNSCSFKHGDVLQVLPSILTGWWFKSTCFILRKFQSWLHQRRSWKEPVFTFGSGSIFSHIRFFFFVYPRGRTTGFGTDVQMLWKWSYCFSDCEKFQPWWRGFFPLFDSIGMWFINFERSFSFFYWLVVWTPLKKY